MRLVKKTCRAYTGKGFKAMSCKKARATWVKASGRNKWSLKLKVLRAGRYELRSRATDGAGVVQNAFKAGAGKRTLSLK